MAAALETMISGSWSVLTSTNFPGTGISLAAVLLGASMAVVSLQLLGNIFGFSIGGSIGRLNRAVHGGNNKNIRISEKRRGDSK